MFKPKWIQDTIEIEGHYRSCMFFYFMVLENTMGEYIQGKLENGSELDTTKYYVTSKLIDLLRLPGST